MGEQQNCAKKRAFATMSAVNKELQSTKKRVVLGELTNSVVESDFTDKNQNTEPKLKKPVKMSVAQKPVQTEIVVGSDDDSRKCGFASLIYKHLRSLELRVDGVLMRLRDTRMHCIFGESRKPIILRESCWRETTFQALSSKGYPSDSAAYIDPSIINQRLPIILHKTQKLIFPD